jgi:hypothetical protein
MERLFLNKSHPYSGKRAMRENHPGVSLIRYRPLMADWLLEQLTSGN